MSVTVGKSTKGGADRLDAMPVTTDGLAVKSRPPLFECRVVIVMKCRAGCGACCIAPSISSFIPGMPRGKKAGERCIHLSEAGLCTLFGKPERPRVCSAFEADEAFCGETAEQAIQLLGWLEQSTA